ncbi:MAG: 1,4-alpha-glucan branching protein GlgB [Halanaerobiaceae bacterium]
MSLFEEKFSEDKYLFHEGTLYQSYLMLGAHICEFDGVEGTQFTVWAPSAEKVSVVGNFNDWNGSEHSLQRIPDSGLWTIFVPGLGEGTLYKYEIFTRGGQRLLKSDPYAFFAEKRPNTASIVYTLDNYNWGDDKWLQNREDFYAKPVNIYEVHLGTWLQKDNGGFYNYRDLARKLVDHVLDMGYTHIEVLPLNEHPLDRSWGYQVTGYYAVTSRYGKPEDFKYFVDYCHQHGIGVIMDWVPGHFCKDDHGLRRFDGTALYEYGDPRKAEKQEWGTLTFDFGKNEVRSFLISNAIFWFDVYHIDGLRVDAVASMLYPAEGETNREAVDFIRNLNEAVFEYFPTVLMVAEESSAWPLVTAPTYQGGLGFNYKWNMGWMNDMLEFIEYEPVHRKWHHNLITFSLFYAFSENFILPLSHDEVVYGKKSLLNKMPGDYWQKFAGLRVFMAYMMTHPGKKLSFMGGEFAQFDEWKDDRGLDWFLLDYEMHRKYKEYCRELNHFYLEEASLWELDHDPLGFEWIDANNNDQSIISFYRRGRKENDFLLVVCNFTPAYYDSYRLGVPKSGVYSEVFNTDLECYGGSGKENLEAVKGRKGGFHGQDYYIEIKVPPLAAVVLKCNS